MGLTIYYNGRFNGQTLLSEMIEEVKDVAEVNNWHYHIFETVFPDQSFGRKSHNNNIYGICFSPPKCEPVWLTFLSNGRMSSPANLEFYGSSKNKAEREYLYMLFTKTQYAGSHVHKLIVHLLKYLNKKYLLDFNVTDEGNYWETGDEKLLDDTFKEYSFIIDGFSNALDSIPINSGESFTTFFKRLMKIVDRKRKGKDPF